MTCLIDQLASQHVVDLFRTLRRRRRVTDPVQCCGIVAYCGQQDASRILCNGVALLQNRGYDSCGITTLNKKKMITTKFASKGTTSDSVDLLKQQAPQRHGGHTMGIAHTRWATHGGKTDENAHPHHDYKNRVSVVHNGTIDNFDVLKAELDKLGIPFKSQTDTEVIANLIGRHLDLGMTFQDAVRKTVDRLRGTWGLVVMHKDTPDGFMCARNGSPLILGSSKNEVFVASEPVALAEHTNEYLALNDGDVVFISNTKGLDHLELGRDKRLIPLEDIEHEPSPFKHWTIREIYEQPQSLARALNYGARLGAQGRKSVKLGGLDLHSDKMAAIKNLVITGCGTSLNAGLYGELLMRHLDCFDSVTVVDSSEVDSKSFTKPPNACGILALSQSGETRDVVTALEEAERLQVHKLSIVNQVGSLVARMTNCGVYLNAGREVAVASTKAFTSQVAVLSLVACWFAQHRDCSDTRIASVCDAIHRLPLNASQMLGLDSQCRRLAGTLINSKDLFILGKGFANPVALEGALKIKEISYVHAEGFGGGQLKHGPFALLDEKAKTPVVLIVLKDAHQPAMINCAQQVKARGARLVVITDDPTSVAGLADETIKIPSNGPLTALNAVFPLQMIAYHMAVLKGINPDKPRGLAKTVTVM